MPPKQLGPYRIEKLLGRGGMGSVFLGVHQDTGEAAALKVLSEVHSDDPRFRDRFMSEVESLRKLRHPNIVRLLGHGEEDGQLFFVMEYVDGLSLDGHLRDGRRFTWIEVADIGVQICDALKHAHAHGIIHRDLKPANLLWNDTGIVKLTDFGIAKLFGGTQLTLAGSIIGTPDFMSPEQTEGKPVTALSDLYSVGVVLYTLLTGKPPFHGAAVTKIIERVRFEEPTPIRYVVRDIPDELDNIISELLSKDPKQRIATPQLLANRLKAMRFALMAETIQEACDGPASDEMTIELETSQKTRTLDGKTRCESADTPTSDYRASTSSGKERQEAGPDRDPTGNVGETIPSVRPSTEVEQKQHVTTTHFTVVTEDQWRGSLEDHPPTESSKTQRWGLLGMAIALLGIVAGFVVTLRPLSADQLYQRMEGCWSAESPSDEGYRLMDEFLRRYPDDPRCRQVRWHLQDWDCQDLYDSLTNKVRELSVAERVYLEGWDALQNGEAELAAGRFQQVIEAIDAEDENPRHRRLRSAADHLVSEPLK